MGRLALASWLVVICCLCCVACGRRGRGGGGFPVDSGTGNDAGDQDSGSAGGDGGADAGADASVDASTDAASDATSDATADTGPITPPTAPDSNCDGAEFNGHYYWFCTDNRDWDVARPLCMGGGGDLVSINDATEQAFIEDHAPTGTWLIGVNKKNASGASTAGTWEMVDGTTLDAYENWGLGEPDSGDCGALGGTGRWSDISCTNAENWICEVP